MSARARGFDERGEQTGAVVGLGMPLHAERPPPVSDLYRLDDAVFRPAGDHEAVAEVTDRLVMVTVG